MGPVGIIRVGADVGALMENNPMEPRAWDSQWAGLGEEIIVLEAMARLDRLNMRHAADRSHEEHLALACLSLISRLDDARRLSADIQSVAAIEQRARAAVAELERMRVVDQRRQGALVELIGALERVRELLAPA